MFNLLMFNVDWLSGGVTIPKGRMFEHTEAGIAAQFRDGSNNLQLDHLTSLPCLFCTEGTGRESAYVGRINQARSIGNNLSLEISFDAEVPTLTNSMIYADRFELDMPSDFEFSRNHWAVKNRDIYRFLLRSIRSRRQKPTVFSISEYSNIDSSLISVMMPFAAEFNTVYESICQAANNVGLECLRADDIWETHSIIQDVVSLIDRSRMVICDCTGRNPNVFYEAGIAHTLGREVILITQHESDIPFDLRHLRHVKYLDNEEGRASLVQALQTRMHTVLGN